VSEFTLYLRLGATHIADLAGYDHILFVAALAVSYPPHAWRRLGLLVTAFTLGHSVTLALATMNLVRVSAAVVEALIPATIFVTAALQAWQYRSRDAALAAELHDLLSVRFGLATVFGLIHGLGFSTFLRALLGAEESLLVPLLAFNLGLELGQLLILAAVLLLGVVATGVLGRTRRVWVLCVACLTGAVAIRLLIERWPLRT
jgi:hypothetical protein